MKSQAIGTALALIGWAAILFAVACLMAVVMPEAVDAAPATAIAFASASADTVPVTPPDPPPTPKKRWWENIRCAFDLFWWLRK